MLTPEGCRARQQRFRHALQQAHLAGALITEGTLTSIAELADRMSVAAYLPVRLILTERFGGNHVGVMRTPIADADLGIFADNVFKAQRIARGRVE